MAIVAFKSKTARTMRIKLKESEISGYTPDGRPMYTKQPGYVSFDKGNLVMDTEKDADMIERLRAHPSCGIDFVEVGTSESTNKANTGLVKFNRDELRGMSKSTLIAIAEKYGIKVTEVDTKDMLINGIVDKQA